MSYITILYLPACHVTEVVRRGLINYFQQHGKINIHIYSLMDCFYVTETRTQNMHISQQKTERISNQFNILEKDIIY